MTSFRVDFPSSRFENVVINKRVPDRLFFLLFIGWKIIKRTKWIKPAEADIFTGKAALDAEDAHWPDQVPRNLLEKVRSLLDHHHFLSFKIPHFWRLELIFKLFCSSGSGSLKHITPLSVIYRGVFVCSLENYQRQAMVCDDDDILIIVRVASSASVVAAMAHISRFLAIVLGYRRCPSTLFVYFTFAMKRGSAQPIYREGVLDVKEKQKTFLEASSSAR